MKKVLSNLQWVIDYYLVYFMYKTDKIDRYHSYMSEKYGQKYNQ